MIARGTFSLTNLELFEEIPGVDLNFFSSLIQVLTDGSGSILDSKLDPLFVEATMKLTESHFWYLEYTGLFIFFFIKSISTNSMTAGLRIELYFETKLSQLNRL